MMYLRLLALQGRREVWAIAVAAVLAAGGGLGVLVVINTAAEEMARRGSDQIDWIKAAFFLASAATYFLAEAQLVGRVGAGIEYGIHALRMRLIDRLVEADYARLERFGQADLYQSITQNSQMMTDNSHWLAMAMRAVVLQVGIMVYVLWLSPLAFAIILATVAVGGVLYVRRGRRVQAGFRSMMAVEGRLFGAVQDLFDGIKEVRLSSRRSAQLGRAFCSIAAGARREAIAVQGLSNGQFVLGEVTVYVLLALIVFVLPIHWTGFDDTVQKVTTAVLFMLGPVGAILGTVPMLTSADSAVRGMRDLEDDLAAMAAEPPAPTAAMPEDFAAITVRGAGFTYPAPDDEIPFTVGPVDLTVRRGEVVFVTGGNGSGKSSFIKLLTGLYAPHRGTLAIDDVAVTAATVAAYRDRIACVFSDSHLFARLYGVPTPDPEEVQALFRLFEMEHVTSIVGDRFARTAVSMGQRKRLALIAALLEHKPILVLDEWAADQDPHFRRVFYREILPMLRERGTTVIAVTHDDHYFDAADRILTFREGTMTEVPPPRREDRP